MSGAAFRRCFVWVWQDEPHTDHAELNCPVLNDHWAWEPQEVQGSAITSLKMTCWYEEIKLELPTQFYLLYLLIWGYLNLPPLQASFNTYERDFYKGFNKYCKEHFWITVPEVGGLIYQSWWPIAASLSNECPRSRDMAAAEKQARLLRGAKKILLASELYINSCRGPVWGHQVYWKEGHCSCRWKGKEKNRYNVLSLFSACQEGKSRVKSNFHLNLSQRGRVGILCGCLRL